MKTSIFPSDKEELLFYRQLFSCMNASVYVVNIDPYKIEWVAPNSLLSRIIGLDQETILSMGDTIYGRLMEEPDFKESIVEALEKFDVDPDVNWGGVYRVNNFKNEIRWIVYSTKTLIKDKAGKAIKAVCVAIDANDIFCTPETLQYFNEYVNTEINRDTFNGLTKRQKDVLAGLTAGLSIRDISKDLAISHHTVIDHKKALFKKLECRSVLELVQLARAKGLS